MKTWKLVSGIISTVLSVFVVFQSMMAGLPTHYKKVDNPVAVQDLLLVYACFVEELYRLYLERTTLKAQTLHLLFCLV